tara:strand:+ start:18645 stop:18875 length:231 start_codon:yes stop_codon:yes gene_type:complete
MSDRVEWLSEVDECQMCGISLEDEGKMVDGKLRQNKYNGQWALMCCGCYTLYGVGIGLGLGQLYHLEDGRWFEKAG